MAEPTSTTNGAPAASPASGDSSPGDVLSRLEAAGIDDIDDVEEDLSDLDDPSEGGDPPEPAEGDDPAKDGDEDEDPKKPKDEDTLGLKGKGTREKPLLHKELPADKFVKLKAPDGSEVVVSLKDAVAGVFMSKAMVDRHVSVAKESEERAKGIAVKAIEHQRRANEYVRSTLEDPQRIIEHLAEQHMPVLHQLAKSYAMMRKDPNLHARVVAEIREKRLAAQQQSVAQQQQALQRQQQEAAAEEELKRTVAPGYKRGLRELGILRDDQITDDLRRAVRKHFQFFMSEEGRHPSSAEMRQVVLDAGADLRAKGKLPAPRAKPKPALAPAEPIQRPSNGKKDWSQVPESVRMRDPDFLFNKAARASVRSRA